MRRTLAYSLHQLAIILGDELTRTDILPVFEDFMHDVDEVRIALMKHMCDFLQVYILLVGLSLSEQGRNHVFKVGGSTHGENYSVSL